MEVDINGETNRSPLKSINRNRRIESQVNEDFSVKRQKINCSDLSVVEWLHQNFIPFEGKFVTVAQMKQKYSEFSSDKENCLSEEELGRLLRKVYGKAIKRQKRTVVLNPMSKEKKRAWAYTGLADIETVGFDREQVPHVDLKTYKPPSPWITSLQTDEVCEYLLRSELSEDKRPLFKRIQIFKDWTFKVSASKFQVPNELFGFSKLQPVHHALDTFFESVTFSELCTGFAVTTNKLSRNRKGEIIGGPVSISKSVHDAQPQHKLRHRSFTCHGLVNGSSAKSNLLKICKSCSSIKRNSEKNLSHNDSVSDKSIDVKHKRESYMNDEEKQAKLHQLKKDLKNAKDRERYAKEKIESEMHCFSDEDNNDFTTMFNRINKDELSEDMKIFWEVQARAMTTKNSKGNRWHSKVIRLCLSIWNRSPEAYKELRDSGMIKLPSGRLLSFYKNSISQDAMFNEDVLNLMVREARQRKIGKEGMMGGIVLDEMSIQEDLQMKTCNGVTKLIGLVELGQEHEDIKTIENGEDKARVASHVLQLVFLGNTGFRFPFAHFPTLQADPASIYINFWKAVRWLRKGGFDVFYCCCDGGEANRSFIKMHFVGKDPVNEKFTTKNPYTRGPMVFYLDPSHNFKKLRNNLRKSTPNGKRNLTIGNCTIQWKHLQDAFNWDQKNSLPYHQKLSPRHFELDSAAVMRNHLAEQVINKDMKNLVKAYKKHLEEEESTESSFLDKTLEFLEVSTVLVDNFRDKRPYTSIDDERLIQNDNCMNWFQKWETDASTIQNATERNKRMLSDKTRFDIYSMIIGFKEICSIAFNANPGAHILACRTNSDIVENVFCQQRGRNGQNDNPRYIDYGPTMNGILLGQTTTTNKSNTGSVESLPSVKPARLVKRT